MTLQGKKNFGNVIKLRILKGEDYPEKPSLITRGPIRGRRGDLTADDVTLLVGKKEARTVFQRM